MPDGPVNILAIESSCDDTSCAVLTDRCVKSNIVANQEVHIQYGGVVPELASRSHQKQIVPVVQAALKKAGMALNDLNAIAYTVGPGLPGSLIVGNAFAKSLSLSLGIPLIEVHHMQAHILAHFIDDVHEKAPSFPFLCLTVSGGHTQIVKVNSHSDFELLGNTLDDAAGEAFDKIAKMLGLDYPGGPLVDRHAKLGDPKAFSFPHPKVPDLNYSFSGLKTAVLYFLRDEIAKDERFIENNLNDICASVQHTIVQILMQKLIMAAKQEGIREVALAGGVSANSFLRTELSKMAEEHDWATFVPPIQYCTDNAAMIGITAHFKYLNREFSDLDSIPVARMAL